MVLLNKKFSEELNACLEKKYKRKIKNAEFATFYNLQFDRSITSETARKWLLGLSVPNVNIINDLEGGNPRIQSYFHGVHLHGIDVQYHG
jgi:hypothetical protein